MQKWISIYIKLRTSYPPHLCSFYVLFANHRIQNIWKLQRKNSSARIFQWKRKTNRKLVWATCVRCHGTKCPLLTGFFFFLYLSLSSASVSFLPEGVIIGFWNRERRPPLAQAEILYIILLNYCVFNLMLLYWFC